MFGLGGTVKPNITTKQKFEIAETELDMVTVTFNKLVALCYNKCINRSYNEVEISKQESLCLDRCVSKYFETNINIGDHMQELGQSKNFMSKI